MKVWKWVWTGGGVTTIGTRLADGRLCWWMDSGDGGCQGLLRSVSKNVLSLQKDCPRECRCESGLAGQCVRISAYEARLVLGRQTKDNRAWAMECRLEFS